MQCFEFFYLKKKSIGVKDGLLQRDSNKIIITSSV